MNIHPLHHLFSRVQTGAPPILSLTMLLLLFCGCQTPMGTSYPPTNPSDVIVTTDPYSGPCQQIKFLYGMFPGGASREQMAQYLQLEAAKVGADMVVESTLKTDLLGTSEATGRAIKLLR